MGAGGSQSTQQSTDQSSGSGFNLSGGQSFIDPTQMGALSSLWTQAMGQVNPAGSAAAVGQGTGMAMPGINAGLNSNTALAGGRIGGGFGQGRGAIGAGNAALQPLANGNIGGGFLRGQGMLQNANQDLNQIQNRLNPLTNAGRQIKADTRALNSGLNQMWNQTIMPGIKSDAIGSGGFGGGRQGVAEGVGAGQMSQAFIQGQGDLQARARAMALQAMGQQSQAAGMQQQGGQALQQGALGRAGAIGTAAQGLQQGGQALQQGALGRAGATGAAAGQAVGFGGALQSLFANGANAGLAPLAILGQILGNPAILNQQFGMGANSSQSSGSSSGTSQGFDFKFR